MSLSPVHFPLDPQARVKVPLIINPLEQAKWQTSLYLLELVKQAGGVTEPKSRLARGGQTTTI